jgi:hypothetical protein
MTEVRTGQADTPLTRDEFGRRFRQRWVDPAYDGERDAIARLEAIAWLAVDEGRKSPITRPAGAGFADPAYDMSVDWLETHQRLKAAQANWANPGTRSRVLVICGSARNDGTCPGEVSKTWRLSGLVREANAPASMPTCST